MQLEQVRVVRFWRETARTAADLLKPGRSWESSHMGFGGKTATVQLREMAAAVTVLRSIPARQRTVREAENGQPNA